jgi:MYXO-CTERM domain-containing protein
VRNTVTHEVGHFLGLDHTPIEAATMFATAPRGETAKRDLHQDDIDGLCAIYPQGQQGGKSCDLSNVGFFERPEVGPQTQCAAPDGCACTAMGPTGGGGGVAWLAVVGAAALALARRPRRRSRPVRSRGRRAGR